MIARNTKQLKEMFPWCRADILKKVIERMLEKEFIVRDNDTLYDPDSTWYGINWDKLRELKSIVIMGDDEIVGNRVYTSPLPKQSKTNGNGNGDSVRHRALFGAFLKVCHWDKSIKLTPRDTGETGTSVKEMMKRYPDVETEDLKLMLLGVDEYRKALGYKVPFRPSTILRVWPQYVDWCKKRPNQAPPEYQEN